MQLSWLAPHKVRQSIVVGSKRMVVYDDTATDGAVRIYDRGFDFTEPSTFGEYQLTYRSGDMLVPRLDPAEPLGLELADFARRSRPVPRRAPMPAWAWRSCGFSRPRTLRWRRPACRSHWTQSGTTRSSTERPTGALAPATT